MTMVQYIAQWVHIRVVFVVFHFSIDYELFKQTTTIYSTVERFQNFV